ncbi:MAG: FHA domain-containing protein [Armatimonadetes bacterium]|nr:FHA domain-containing protein [Armatimonadota bacterium]
MRILTAFALAALSSLAFAQKTCRIEFPDAGDRLVWTGEPTPPADAKEAKDKSFTLDLTADSKGKVWVLDRGSNRMAVRPIDKVPALWTLKREDWALAGKVTIRVDYRGKPVASARVEAKAGAESRDVLLSPASQGEAPIYGIPFGPLKVVVTTNLKAKPEVTKKDEVTFTLKPDDGLSKTVSVSEETTVIEPTASPSPTADSKSGEPKENSDKEKEPEKKGDATTTWVNWLIGLVIGGGLIAGIFWFLKKNQNKVADQLRQLGVDVPRGDDPGVSPGTPFEPAPAPPQKIILDPVQPIDLGSDAAPTAFAAAPIAMTGQPRLVMANGDEFPLNEGETTIGRELGLELSLPNESTVSRRHAVVVRHGQSVIVRDLGSSNGTFVNGAKIAGDTPIRPGDQVQFGQSVWRFEG